MYLQIIWMNSEKNLMAFKADEKNHIAFKAGEKNPIETWWSELISDRKITDGSF